MRRFRKKPQKLFLAGALMLGLSGTAAPAQAGQHPYDVLLQDADGNILTPASTVPYSPKQTCGVSNSACHTTYQLDGVADHSLYEHAWDLASKTQWNRDGVAQTYDVPYPTHGVSSGYHFQQGRNISWDATKQDFYNLPEFTSSAGMYGKY